MIGYVYLSGPYNEANFGYVAHPLFPSMATGVQGHFLGVKRPEREIDLSFPSNSEVKNNWGYTLLLTYLLTPWSRVFLEKLTGSAASLEIPRFFGTRKFITVLTSARHLSLS